MSRREDIDTAIWSDPDFLGFTPAAKLLYVWTFTNPRCGMSGLYKVVRQAIEMETGMGAKRIQEALDELADARFAYFDGRVMWVRGRIKHLRSKSPNIAKSIGRDVEAIGAHEYTSDLLERYRSVDWLEGTLGTLYKTLGNPSNPSNPSEGVQGKGKGRAGELVVLVENNTPPNPPDGGEGEERDTEGELLVPTRPARPDGKRGRDQSAYLAQMQTYTAEVERFAVALFPDMPPALTVPAVQGALGFVRPGERPLPAEIRAAAERWLSPAYQTEEVA